MTLTIMQAIAINMKQIRPYRATFANRNTTIGVPK